MVHFEISPQVKYSVATVLIFCFTGKEFGKKINIIYFLLIVDIKFSQFSLSEKFHKKLREYSTNDFLKAIRILNF